MELLAAEPEGAFARSVGEALNAPIVAWSGHRPAATLGTVSVVIVAPDVAISTLEGALTVAPDQDAGEVVLVLAPGDRNRARHAAATLPWTRVGLVDPVATASLWADPAGLDDRILGRLAARAIADTYRAPFVAGSIALPPGLDGYLAVPDPAALRSEDVRTRASAARALPSDELVGDLEVAVRLAVAARTASDSVLHRLAADPEPLVRARTAERLDDIGVLDTLTSDASSVVRVVAAGRVASLAGSDPPRATPVLLRLAASPDAYVRWKAAWGLGMVPNGTPALLSLLSDVDVDVRREAAHALARNREPAAIEALVLAARDSNSFVRRWAVDALSAYQGDARVRLALEAAAGDPAALVAQAAARGLGTRPRPVQPSSPPRDAADIEARSAHTDPTVRKELCPFLAGEEAWTPLLVGLAGDRDSEVRKSAIGALGWLPGQAAPLLAALADPDPDVVVTALEALARSGAGTIPVLAPFRTNPDAEMRLRAAEALARLGPSPPLEAALVDPDERVRAAAVSVYPERLAVDEPSVLVRRAAPPPADPDALVRAVLEPSLGPWALGVLAREDDLLHEQFSWNGRSDRPRRTLRPPVVVPYGHPNRG